MNLEDLMNHWSTQQSDHWVYFALGFATGNIVWLTLLLGIGVGWWRKGKVEARSQKDKGYGRNIDQEAPR